VCVCAVFLCLPRVPHKDEIRLSLYSYSVGSAYIVLYIPKSKVAPERKDSGSIHHGIRNVNTRNEFGGVKNKFLRGSIVYSVLYDSFSIKISLSPLTSELS